MYKVYNKRALSRNERFLNAVLYGSGATILLTIAYGLLSSILHIEFSVVYIGFGYAIGYVIQRYGKGVQIQFSILGAVLAVLCFIFGDMISYFGFAVFTNFEFFIAGFTMVLQSLFRLNISGLLSLAFRVYGVILAYQTSRII